MSLHKDFESLPDNDMRLFREEYSDIYEFVLKVLDGNCDNQTLQVFKDDYGEDFLNDVLKIIYGKASEKDIQAFREEYSEEIYNAILKMIQNRKPRREDFPDAVHSREKFKKGDFIGQKYEVFDVLGVGGFGIVYLVYSHETKAAYALKTFRHEYLEDIQTRERFRKEAQVWIDLERHPYLVRAYFVDEISGRLYIAMEHIATDETGLNTLDAYLRKRPPDLAQSLRWAIQFCYGMEHAYSRGIKAHRDIKPANIMIGQDKAVKISDFGLAGIISTSKSFSGIKAIIQQNISGEAYQTMEGTAFGTPPYMPPEQFINVAGCDERSDIYSFGIVLYQMASGGRLPFLPDASGSGEGDVFEIWYMLHSKASTPRLNSPLFPVIQRCLEKEPRKRYLTFKELRSDLEPLLKRETGEVVMLPERKELEAWELSNKGVSLANLGKYQDAIACYDKSLQINPRYALAWFNKGSDLESLGMHQEAIACFDRSLQINPKYAEAWYGKGASLSNLGKYQDAIACYDKALQIDPKCALAWFNKGVTLGRHGKPQEAIACYDKALEINPIYAEAWNNKGVTLGSLGKNQEAIVCFDRVVEINPGYAEAWNNKGVALRGLSKNQEAIVCFDRALEINPIYAEAWYNKALAEEDVGLIQAATLSYKKFIELAPAQYAEQIEYARQRLRELV